MTPVPQKLRALAKRRGQKLTARDAAMLTQAAQLLEYWEVSKQRSMDCYRDQLFELVDTRMRLNALLESLDAAVAEARE